MEERLRLPWLVTAGGPHLVIPERYASAWEGCSAPTKGRVVAATFRYDPDGPATDYDRACDVSGSLGVIRVGRGRAMVLTGHVPRAAYYRWERKHFLLRWVFGDSETEPLDHFYDVHDLLPVEDVATFHHPGGELRLMDSADAPTEAVYPCETFTLPRGRYREETSSSRTDSMQLIVHRLRPLRASK